MSWEAIRSKISGRDVVVFTLSLLLAFAVWLIHNLSFNYKEQVAVPVLAHCSLDGHAYSSSAPSLVHARCRASGFSLIGLLKSTEKPPVEVDFASSDLHHKAGEVFYITAQELQAYSAKIFGEGTNVEAFLSDTLFFRFPYQASRRVPVSGRGSLSYRSQYIACGGFEFEPDSVTVFGEPEIIDRIDKVSTNTIVRSDIAGPLHGTVKLDAIPGVRLSDESVEYDLDVSRYVELVSEVKVSVVNVPSGRTVVVYPAVARVAVRCRFPFTFGNMDGVTLTIDYADFKKSLSGRCLPKAVNLPGGAIDVVVEPEVFDCVEIAL
ncbi:MAG: hypothetical protein IJ151_08760 [Bacteroidales bacterium]|nr:hypothetical protein [Bacteroidales bacterium]